MCFYRLTVVTAAFFILIVTAGYCAPNEKEVRAAMDKAADFMMNTVSNHGGFLQKYV